jgi:hypothetical protein
MTSGVLGLPPAAVGAAIVASRLPEVVTDPLILDGVVHHCVMQLGA